VILFVEVLSLFGAVAGLVRHEVSPSQNEHTKDTNQGVKHTL
jgi:hypothetical protein